MTYIFNELLVAQMEQPQRPTLGSTLRGHIKFIKGSINGHSFYIGSEEDDPQTINVRCASIAV